MTDEEKIGWSSVTQGNSATSGQYLVTAGISFGYQLDYFDTIIRDNMPKPHWWDDMDLEEEKRESIWKKGRVSMTQNDQPLQRSAEDEAVATKVVRKQKNQHHRRYLGKSQGTMAPPQGQPAKDLPRHIIGCNTLHCLQHRGATEKERQNGPRMKDQPKYNFTRPRSNAASEKNKI